MDLVIFCIDNNVILQQINQVLTFHAQNKIIKAYPSFLPISILISSLDMDVNALCLANGHIMIPLLIHGLINGVID